MAASRKQADSASTPDPRITKKRVTMSNPVVREDPNNPGQWITETHTATDYVRPDFLDAYVANARAAGWQSVTVSEEPDAGPGGYDGQTVIPEGLDHPQAGEVFPATDDAPKES